MRNKKARKTPGRTNETHVDHNGIKWWYKDGILHREDGPAVEWPHGYQQWWCKGFFVGGGDKPDPVLWERLTSVEANGGPLLNGHIVDTQGTHWWYRDGKHHREDGPAIVRVDETKVWYFNDEWLGKNTEGFWKLWDLLTEEQRGNTTLLRYMPR